MAPNLTSLGFAEEKLDFNEDLEYRLSHAMNAVDRVRMIVDHFGAEAVTVLTSFGVQSGIMLSLGTWSQFIIISGADCNTSSKLITSLSYVYFQCTL